MLYREGLLGFSGCDSSARSMGLQQGIVEHLVHLCTVQAQSTILASCLSGKVHWLGLSYYAAHTVLHRLVVEREKVISDPYLTFQISCTAMASKGELMDELAINQRFENGKSSLHTDKDHITLKWQLWHSYHKETWTMFFKLHASGHVRTIFFRDGETVLRLFLDKSRSTVKRLTQKALFLVTKYHRSWNRDAHKLLGLWFTPMTKDSVEWRRGLRSQMF